MVEINSMVIQILEVSPQCNKFSHKVNGNKVEILLAHFFPNFKLCDA